MAFELSDCNGYSSTTLALAKKNEDHNDLMLVLLATAASPGTSTNSRPVTSCGGICTHSTSTKY